MDKLVTVSSIAIVFYYILKSIVTIKYFNKETKITLILNIFGILASLYVNQIFTNEYTKMLNTSFVKGAIELPPLWLLIILTDLLTSIFMKAKFKQTSAYSKNNKLSEPIIEIIRIATSYAFFMFILSNLWQHSFEQKLTNNNYICFTNRLQKDFEDYYTLNRIVPKTLQDFTKTTINPINNSKLIYKPAAVAFQVEISDEMGNLLVKGYESFVGLDSRIEQPNFRSSAQMTLDAYNCPTP
jgi:hypothetical protein